MYGRFGLLERGVDVYLILLFFGRLVTSNFTMSLNFGSYKLAIFDKALYAGL